MEPEPDADLFRGDGRSPAVSNSLPRHSKVQEAEFTAESAAATACWHDPHQLAIFELLLFRGAGGVLVCTGRGASSPLVSGDDDLARRGLGG
jgi:hypothetical protein